MAVVCKVTGCPYNRSEMCKKNFTFINATGQCYSLYDKNGMQRPQIYLDAEVPVEEYPVRPKEES